MKSSVSLLSILLVFAFISSCSLNQFAVKSPIAPGASIGIVAYEVVKASQGPSERRDISLDVARNFISKGYAVKALNVIPFYKTYPFLKDMFDESQTKFKAKIEDLLEKSKEVSTSYANDVNIKKELETVKSDMGLDYLLVVYQQRSGGSTKYFLTGIDVGNFEIVYIQSYIPAPGFFLAKIFTPYYDERHFDASIQKFIATINQAGSGSYYGSEK